MVRIVKVPSPAGVAWVAASAVVTGVSAYLLLIVTAQGLGPGEFDAFSVYWAVLMVSAVGGFLPLEQIVARRTAAGTPTRTVRDAALRWGFVTCLLGSLALAAAGVLADRAWPISPTLLVVFALNLAAVSAQSVVRGLAAGTQRLDAYAATTTSDAVLRTSGCVLLAVIGVDSVVAYASAIAAGCAISVATGGVLLGRGTVVRESEPVEPGGSGRSFTREALSLVPAMLSMQLLLNSPILVAFIYVGQGTSAGSILAIASLVRTSVFIMQAGQAAYVARIARLARRSVERARAVTAIVATLTVFLAACTVLGAVLVGPWLVSLLYGDGFIVTRSLCLVVSVGIAAFLLAIVANDLSVAWGRHTRSGAWWVLAVLVAAACVPVLPAGDSRSVLPVLIGSVVALVLILIGARRTLPPAPPRP